MIQPEPLGLDDVPQIKMTAALITVDLLVCRRDSPHPEPGPLDDLACIGSGAAMGRQTDCLGVVHQAFRQHEAPIGRCRQQSGQCLRVEVIRVLVRGQDQLDILQVAPAQQSAGHADVGRENGLVFPREVLGKVGIDHENPAVSLDQIKAHTAFQGGQLASIEYHLKLLCDRHLWRDFLRSRHLL